MDDPHRFAPRLVISDLHRSSLGNQEFGLQNSVFRVISNWIWPASKYWPVSISSLSKLWLERLQNDSQVQVLFKGVWESSDRKTTSILLLPQTKWTSDFSKAFMHDMYTSKNEMWSTISKLWEMSSKGPTMPVWRTRAWLQLRKYTKCPRDVTTILTSQTWCPGCERECLSGSVIWNGFFLRPAYYQIASADNLKWKLSETDVWSIR